MTSHRFLAFKTLPLLVSFIIVLTSCSTSYSTLNDTNNNVKKIYRMSENEALQIAYNAILRSFPGRKVETIDGPIKGFSTYTRFVLDTFTQQVLIRPVMGTTSDRQHMEGFVFEVSGSGTSGSGAMRNAGFFEQLQSDLAKSGRAVAVVSVIDRPFMVSPATNSTLAETDDPIKQIERLKGLLDAGAITPSEYAEKKKEFIGRL